MPDVSHLDLQKDIGALQRETGVLQTEVRHLKEDLTELREGISHMGVDILAIRDIITKARGGWQALAWVGGIGLAVGGLAVKLLTTASLVR